VLIFIILFNCMKLFCLILQVTYSDEYLTYKHSKAISRLRSLHLYIKKNGKSLAQNCTKQELPFPKMNRQNFQRTLSKHFLIFFFNMYYSNSILKIDIHL